MLSKENNFAFIDAANLHKASMDLGWSLDYKRLRIWLRERHAITTAYLFIGLVPKYKGLYTRLQEFGFTLVFKETTCDEHGKVKGNCDADLVLATARGVYENHFDRAMLVSSDGDYASLVVFLQEKNKLKLVLSPGNKCSILLRRTNAPVTYLRDLKTLVERSKKEKAPDADRTAQGPSSW